MFVVAAKVGGGFVLALIISGMIQAHSVFTPLSLFVTVGLVPGTNLQMPAEVILILTALTLMVLFAFFYRRQTMSRLALKAALPRFLSKQEDPPYTALVPGLGSALMIGSSVRLAAREVAQESYIWFRSLGRPIIGQAVVMHKELRTTLVRVDQHWSFVLRPREQLDIFGTWLRTVTEKAQAYMLRITLL